MPSLSEIGTYLPNILLAYSVILLAIFSPGPAVLAIMGMSMHHGRSQGVFLALGVVCGSAFWGCMAAIGLAGILTAYSNALIAIKLIGGLYLLFLAYKSLRSALNSTEQNSNLTHKEGSPWRLWRNGLLLHLTNPKSIIVWVATVALGVSTTAPIWVSIAIVAGGIIISLLGNLGYAILFSTQSMANMYLSWRRQIQFSFAGFFTFAGVKLLTSKT